MKHRIDPKIDCIFKAMLGSEENLNLLVYFLIQARLAMKVISNSFPLINPAWTGRLEILHEMLYQSESSVVKSVVCKSRQ